MHHEPQLRAVTSHPDAFEQRLGPARVFQAELAEHPVEAAVRERQGFHRDTGMERDARVGRGAVPRRRQRREVDRVMQASGLKPGSVRVHTTYMGGSFGSRGGGAFVAEASAARAHVEVHQILRAFGRLAAHRAQALYIGCRGARKKTVGRHRLFDLRPLVGKT